MSLDELERVNEAVNRLPYKSDPEWFDDWSPIDGGGGDCDSYAVGKLRRLVEAGWPVERLRLATCFVENGGYHAVLIASTDDGDWMLDNRQPRVVPVGDIEIIGYRTDKIQQAGGSRDWVEWKGVR